MKFTIFTPTFNRKELLGKLYSSLQNQTYRDFEWLIVDDGSNDGTEERVKEFINDYKSKLDNFTKEQTALFEKFKSESEVDLLKQKAETDRILEKLNLLDKGIFDQIKSAFKWKN